MTVKEISMPQHFCVLTAELQPFELDTLSITAPIDTLVRIATHRNTPRRTLARLAASSHSDVRCAVGENAGTPLEVLRCLARDIDPDVRYSLAENHNLCVEILNMLLGDENPYVAVRAQRTIERIMPAAAVQPLSASVSSQNLTALVAACA